MAQEFTLISDPTLSVSLKAEIERCWLQSAKVARKGGHIRQGEWALLGEGCGQNIFVERAKWQWVKGEQHQAVTTLHRGIERFFPSADTYKGDSSKNSENELIACSKAKLFLARYSEESATSEANIIKLYYRDACEMYKQWEDGHFHLAMYYDRISSSMDKREKHWDWINHIVQSFGKSLQYGCHHIYQSMPRRLTLWLEFGTRVTELQAKEDKTRTNKKNSSVDFLREKPLNLSGVSSYQMRVKRCLEIFESAKRKNADLHRFISDCTKLADKFLELSNKPVEKVTIRIMREERKTLMSVLRPFIYDPLVKWSRGDNKAKAQMHISIIEQRLIGQVSIKSRGINLPLSVEGQVNALIEEATSIDNLCQMYIGWAAYM